MFLARITGSVVSTQKVGELVGQKLLIVEPLRVNERTKAIFSLRVDRLCVDTVGAGHGEVVLCVQGSSARFTPTTKTLPIDAAIVGIIDSVRVHEKTVFDSRSA